MNQHSAFIRLLEHVPFSQVKATLAFAESTKQINQLIRSRFDFVAGLDSTQAPPDDDLT